MCVRLIVFLFFIFCKNANSEQVIVDKKRLIRDELEQILKENNIIIDSKEREIIANKCLPKISNFTFNECRLKLTLSYYFFYIDQKICKNLHINPASNDQNNYIISKNDYLNPKIPSTQENELLSYKPNNIISQISDSDYYRCMREKEWLNPNNPYMGKAKPFYKIINKNYIVIN